MSEPGHSSVSHIFLLQMIVKAGIKVSPPLSVNPAGMLLAPGDFPPFRFFHFLSYDDLSSSMS